MNSLERAVNVFNIEIDALRKVRDSLNQSFSDVIRLVIESDGKVILLGMGKSGHIARKIAATLSSLGTSAFFVHPAEAAHGDLGMVEEKDVIIAISNSGETDEVLQLLPSIRKIGCKIVSMTSNEQSTLSRNSDISIVLDIDKEACLFNIAPTASTTAALVYGDALAIALSEIKKFEKDEFGIFHPKGSIGKKLLTKVSDIMHTGNENPVIDIKSTIRDALLIISEKAFGIVSVIDENGRLLGIITGGDIIRSIDNGEDILSKEVSILMNTEPISIKEDLLVVTAIEQIKKSSKKLVVLPVVNEERICTGVLSVNDLVKERFI